MYSAFRKSRTVGVSISLFKLIVDSKSKDKMVELVSCVLAGNIYQPLKNLTKNTHKGFQSCQSTNLPLEEFSTGFEKQEAISIGRAAVGQEHKQAR
jgi:hypothetical protein